MKSWRACSTGARDEEYVQILVRKPQGKRPENRLEDNIKMNLAEIGCDDVD
jgi:hypothetical protein